ncbi:MAG: choice-of-anchor D domain-containing protein [Acidobacteriia bacterium]|nr:choice-of-anchor D domain-containing protein [Terriglobia bacterium]
MTRAIILAFLLPLAADAQIGQLALFAMNGSTEVPIGGALDMGKVATGDTVSVRIRLRNTGAGTLNITRFSSDGAQFRFEAPSVPFPIAPGKVQDVLLSVSASTPARYSANLQVTSDVNTIGVMAIATVVVGPLLTVFPVCTGSDGPPPSIDFGSVQSGQLRLCNFYLKNPSAQEMTIATFQVTGSGFQISTGPKAPFKIAAGDTTAFVVTFTPNAAGLFTGALAIETRTYALKGAAFDTPLSKPLLEFDSGPVQSAQQRRLTMRLPAAATAAASGSIFLAFLPDTTLVTDDPAVVFLATGTRSLPFSISKGSTQISINGQTSALFQTGTSVGRIRFTISGITTDGDATTLLTIPASPVSLDTATATRRTGNLDIQLTGFDNTYSAGAMTFTFFDTSGQTLQPGTISADFTQDFRAFFTKTQAGSMFQVRVSFPVTGDTSGIGSVDVQLTNSAGVKLQHLIFQ